MSNWREHGPVTDEDLVAYLDGMLDAERAEHVEREINLDPALEDRLELLRRGDRPYQEAYDLLLREAPDNRLKQILKQAKEPPPREPELEPEAMPASGQVAHPGPWGGWRVLAAAAVLLAVFGSGLYTSRLLQLPGLPQSITPGPGKERGWRAAVADYQVLFIRETLEQAGRDPVAQQANLNAALDHLGLDLTVARVSVAPLEFSRAEVLEFKGKPLVQMAYLFNGMTPVSFCIIKSRKPAHGVMSEQRQGLNIAHWRSKEYGFMVIGDVPAKALDDIARKLKQQLS